MAILAIGLVREWMSPDVLMLMALVVLTLTSGLGLEAAFQGFANTTLVAIGSLYVVAAGLREAGVLDRAGDFLLGTVSHLRQALVRMTGTVALSSAFLNNTPIVAMGIPAIRSWAQKHDISATKLLMPLSFASILGGMCTLIGTSTNLVTDGLLRSHGLEGLGFFELAWIGVPLALVGGLYLVFVAPGMLGEPTEIRQREEQLKWALLELELDDTSPYIGQTIEASGLDEIAGFRLVKLQRGQRRVGPVEAEETLHAGDHLFYAPAGAEDQMQAVPNLSDFPGLRIALHPASNSGAPERGEVHEAVVREGSELIGSTVEQVHFPQRFGAVVTGVRRGGHRVEKPLGEIRLRHGDVLMLDTGRGFRQAHEDSSEFFIVSPAGSEPEAELKHQREERPSRKRAVLAVAILAGVVGGTVAGLFHIAQSSLLGACLMIALGFLTPGQAREAVDWSVLLIIGASLGIAHALEVSGAAQVIGRSIVEVSNLAGPVGVLGGTMLATMVLTGLLTNNAAAALMFPIALSAAQASSLDPRPILIGMTLMTSLSLWTPLGYQTNLMVYGTGNYQFRDFIRVGLPLQLLLAIVAIALIPFVWSF